MGGKQVWVEDRRRGKCVCVEGPAGVGGGGGAGASGCVWKGRWEQGRIQEIEKGGSGVMHLPRPLLVDHTHLIADKCW